MQETGKKNPIDSLLLSIRFAKEYLDELSVMYKTHLAEHFDCFMDNISLHLKNVFKESELTKIQLPRIPR